MDPFQQPQQGSPGYLGANPFGYPANPYFPTGGGYSASGMNPGIMQQGITSGRRNDIELQANNSIYGEGPGSDKRIDALITSMEGVFSKQQIEQLKTPGSEFRNFGMAMINQNPQLNKLFGGYGNSMNVAMGARQLIDSSAGVEGVYGGRRGQATASAQLTRNLMGSFQNDKGELRSEYGANYEETGFALQALASGGGMKDLYSQGEGGKMGLDKGQTTKIKQYVKETVDTLAALKDIYGPMENEQLMRLASEMTGLDPTKIQNARKIKEQVHQTIELAEVLGYTPTNFIEMQKRGADTAAQYGNVPQVAAAVFSRARIADSAVEHDRQQRQEEETGFRAMTTEEIHQRRMRSTAKMIGNGEPGSIGNMALGVREALNMNKQGGGGWLSPKVESQMKRALASGDINQLREATSTLADHGFSTAARAEAHDMNTRLDLMTDEELQNYESDLVTFQQGQNRDSYFENVIGKQFLQSGNVFQGSKRDDLMGKTADLNTLFGGKDLSDKLKDANTMSKKELTASLMQDEGVRRIAEAKGVDPAKYASKLSGQLREIVEGTGGKKDFAQLVGGLRTGEAFSARDDEWAGSSVDRLEANAARIKAKKRAKRSEDMERTFEERELRKEDGRYDFAKGVLSGDYAEQKSVTGELKGLSNKGLDEVGEELEKEKTRTLKKMDAADDSEKQKLQKQLQEIEDAKQELKNIKDEKKGEVQPVRLIGDVRIVDDNGNSVALVGSRRG